MYWSGQSCESEEGEAQLEPSTQPDRLRFRGSSNFFPNKRLGTTVPGDKALDSRPDDSRVQSPGREVEGRDPRVWLPCYLCTLFPWR